MSNEETNLLKEVKSAYSSHLTGHQFNKCCRSLWFNFWIAVVDYNRFRKFPFSALVNNSWGLRQISICYQLIVWPSFIHRGCRLMRREGEIENKSIIRFLPRFSSLPPLFNIKFFTRSPELIFVKNSGKLSFWGTKKSSIKAIPEIFSSLFFIFYRYCFTTMDPLSQQESPFLLILIKNTIFTRAKLRN